MSPKLHPCAKWVHKLQIKGIKNMPRATMLSLLSYCLIPHPLCFTGPEVLWCCTGERQAENGMTLCWDSFVCVAVCGTITVVDD